MLAARCAGRALSGKYPAKVVGCSFAEQGMLVAESGMGRTMSKYAGAGLVAFGILVASSSQAQAQSAAIGEASDSESITVGQWQIRPSLQLRTRAEFRRNPFDTGGEPVPSSTTTSAVSVMPTVKDQWLVLNRGRLGLRADHDSLRAVVEIQDARVWGEQSPSNADSRDQLPTTSAHVAYAEVHGQGLHASYFRVGRQEVEWGDGRLLGRNDFSLAGRSLDAARAQLVVGDFDLEAFASILSPAGALPPEARRGSTSGGTEGTGAQLHGLRATWNLAPLLKFEAQGLARYVRIPTDNIIVPSDVFVGALRVSGSNGVISYALEGAYEGGRIAIVGDTPQLQAYAGAAKFDWVTGLPWKLTVGGQGAYASGQKAGDSKITRFEPILPDSYTNHGPMSLVAWSNSIDAGGHVHVAPWRETTLRLGYHHLELAQASDQWIAGSLLPIGSSTTNTAHNLGNELDLTISYAPYEALRFAAGYSAFLTGAAAKEILQKAGRGEPDIQHYGYLQMTMKVP
jgi:hypothetical protein